MAKDSRNVKFVTILVVAAAAVGCRTARHNSNNIVFGRVAVQLSSRSVLYECIIGKNKLQHQQATAEFLVQKLTLFIGVALNMLFSYSNEIQSIVMLFDKSYHRKIIPMIVSFSKCHQIFQMGIHTIIESIRLYIHLI